MAINFLATAYINDREILHRRELKYVRRQRLFEKWVYDHVLPDRLTAPYVGR
jgi:hypothetical protein